jgi:SET domain-containing protein
MGRKYTYTLNDQVCIDSLSAGNPSRFINHSARPNCYAKGEFRCSSLMPQSLTAMQSLL